MKFDAIKFDEIAQRSPITLSEAAAEFVGTFMLVLVIGYNVLAGVPTWGAMSIAAALAVLVYGLAPVSGAHLNPAVSVTLGLCGKCSWEKVGAYAFLQLLGGINAGVGYLFLFDEGVNLAPTAGHWLFQAGLAEIFYTCFLCLVVLNVAASKMHGGANEYYGLAIGGVIVAGAYSGGSISKGCFNPAVAMALNLSGGGISYGLAYTVCEVLGAGMAAGIFKFTRPEDFDSTQAKDVVYPLKVKLVAEFVGTFLLMLTAGLDVASKTNGAAVSIAASLTCSIFALGSVSGGHFNPAVTLAVLGAGRKDAQPVPEAAAYAGVQTGAGVFAALVFLLVSGGASFPLGPAVGHSWAQAMLCEAIFTFILAFVVLSVTAKVQTPPLAQFAPLAVGLCVVCGGLAAGGISGGVLNPAVAAGVALAHTVMGGGALALAAYVPYAVAQLAGGALAAAAFRFVRPSEYDAKLQAQAESYGATA